VRYRPDGPPALDRVSLDLPPGRRGALVGANRAGKSTFAAVLLRFCELSAGAALLNGHDLASFAADDVRSVVGGCPQDPHLFNTTIRDKLRLARPDVTDEQLEAAAARARLLPWIVSLPRGWETPAGTGGAAVSAGERQRLALARAFLADPALLILDEPTAHLDPPARRALTADLLHATEGRSVLLITHEVDGLDRVDQVVVLDQGGSSSRAATGSSAARADTTSGCERTNISRSADRTVIDGAVSRACSRTGHAHGSPAVSSSALAPALSRGELRIPRCNGGYTNGRTIPAARVIPAASTSQLKGAGGSGTRLSFAM
jgi:ABC-type bacteriocin/lantibiotic exporter with double-glycine peptidase domain